MLRHVDSSSAAVWVETDAPCRVEILGVSSPTFALHRHHYGLVALTHLAPGSSRAYTVSLDGAQAWPEPGSELPPSRIRTIDPQAPVRLVFGSRRTSVPHDLTHGFDMLRCFANELRNTDESEWPTTLILLGDQVYADEPPETALEFIRERRGTDDPPDGEVRDFDEFAELYRIA